jgi:uncharacterized protein GlcG (DUF336 family)
MVGITLLDGMRALEAGFQRARELGIIVAVSVVDARGDLIVSARMDGSLWWWTETSRAKAFASVAYGGMKSGDLIDRSNNPVAQALVHMHQGRIAPQQGAIPLFRSAVLFGAIGAAGGSGAEDEDVSAVAVQSIS